MSHWYAVRTNPKCETKATRNLRSAGFGVYLPQMKIERQHRRTKKWIERTLPLMPSYLFVEMPAGPEDWFGLRRCQGIHSVMGIDGVPIPIERPVVWSKTHQRNVYGTHPVERLMAMQANLEFDDTREAKIRRGEIQRGKVADISFRFPVGSRVRAKDGPFKAFGGLVTNVSARGEVEAMVELLGGLVPVKFPAEYLEVA